MLETLQALQLLLPHSSQIVPSDRCLPSFPVVLPAFQVSKSQVAGAIRSFPAGSAGGPGFRLRHLLNLVCSVESGPDLLVAVTSFTNLHVQGRCPVLVAPILRLAT